jgi:hypothetical protein
LCGNCFRTKYAGEKGEDNRNYAINNLFSILSGDSKNPRSASGESYLRKLDKKLNP